MKKILFDCDYVPGVAMAYAIPASDFLLLTPETADGIAILDLTSTSGIVELPTYADDLAFSEVPVEDGGLVAYDVTVTGSSPVTSSQNEDVLRRLEEGSWLLLFKTKGGSVKLAGSEDIPLRFTRETQVTKAEDRVRFTFSGLEEESALFVGFGEVLAL